MAVAVTSRLYFAVTFPVRTHLPVERLSLLARRQMGDLDVIETIDHLFRCQRCFENYRRVRRHLAGAVFHHDPRPVPVAGPRKLMP